MKYKKMAKKYAKKLYQSQNIPVTESEQRVMHMGSGLSPSEKRELGREKINTREYDLLDQDQMKERRGNQPELARKAYKKRKKRPMRKFKSPMDALRLFSDSFK